LIDAEPVEGGLGKLLVGVERLEEPVKKFRLELEK